MQAQDGSSKHYSPAIPACSLSDNRQLLPGAFAAVAEAYAAFAGRSLSVDAASDVTGLNSHCDRFYSPLRDFMLSTGQALAGSAIWLNPPFRLIQQFLQHYHSLKRQNPDIGGCVLVPDWKNTSWRPLLQGFTLLKRFEAGSVLFRDPLTGNTMKGVPWGVEIWGDRPQSLAKLGSAHSSSKPTMSYSGTVNGAKCPILLDTGASECFFDLSSAQKLGLPVTPTLRTIEVADGHTILCTSMAKLSLHIGDLRTNVWVNLIDLGVRQVILGDNWLLRERARLDFATRTCRVSRNGRDILLTPTSLTPSDKPPPAMLTAVQLKRHIKGGGKFYFVNVVDTGVTPVHQAIHQSIDELSCSADMTKLLHSYADVFEDITQCPPAREELMQHAIPLIPGSKPFFRPMRRYSPAELQVINDMIADLLKKGLIEPSSSPWGAAVVLALKKDGKSFRCCVDWRKLNDCTIKDRYPLPLIDQLFDALSGAQYVSSLDMNSGYFQLLIPPEERPLTAFRTPHGHYQFKVLGQGLTNAPATFMRAMHRLFKDQLNKSVFIYLDDIVIASKTQEEHMKHVQEVLQVLRDNQFYAKLSKCEFEKEELKFLGHIIGRHGLRPDPAKISVVQDWPTPASVKDVRSFLGLANYFRKFIQGFSNLAAPLTTLTKKVYIAAPFRESWDASCQKAFEGIKLALTQAPTLKLPDFSKPFEVIADASVIGIGAVLLQEGHPIAYISRRLIPAEVNYTTTEQELLAVVHALNAWRCYLEGAAHDFTIVSDHHPLVHLQTQPELSRRQARWVEFLQRFHWKWEYRPGRINVADPLSRVFPDPLTTQLMMLTRRQARAQVEPQQPTPTVPAKRKRAEESQAREAPLVPPVSSLGPAPVTGNSSLDLLPQLQAAYDQDPWFSDPNHTSNLRKQDGVWWRGSQIVLPNMEAMRKHILYELHDTPYSGHPGRDKTLEAVSRLYWWPGMGKDVKAYVQACPHCQRNKSANAKPPGLLQPLPTPEHPWDSVSMDLITQLPKTESGKDAILVVVCRLIKMVHIIPTTCTVGALGVAKLYRDHVWKLHGVPKDVVSDRGKEFCNAFTAELYRLIGTQQKLSTAYHPQTDGQTERVNRVLEDMVRNYVGGKQDDWDEYLAAAEFAINNSYHASIGTTPFRLWSGRDPNLPVTVQKSKHPNAAVFADKMVKGLADAKKCLEAAKQRQKAYADDKRRHLEFKVGDQVLLSSKNINIRMPQDGTKKLLPKWIGPFTITKQVNKVAYKLDLPDHMKRIHNVFHISLLKQFYSDGRSQPPPPPIEIDGENYYLIERILDHKIGKGRNARKYLVRWLGYPPEHDTWEPESIIAESENGDTLRKYWEYTGLEPPTRVASR